MKKISLKYKLHKDLQELKSLMKTYVFKIFMGPGIPVKDVSAAKHLFAWLQITAFIVVLTAGGHSVWW